MSVIELYDGEERTRYWWRVIIIHSILVPPALFGIYLLMLGYGDIAGFNIDALTPYVRLILLVFFLLPFFFIGMSLAFPRFMFAFYVWDFRMLPICVFIGYIFVWYFNENPRRGNYDAQLIFTNFVFPVLVWLGCILIKTILIYTRFSLVEREKGRQKY